MPSPPTDHARLAAALVAHRGEPTRYPENSLAGFRAALRNGARAIETDIQLSRDGVAVLNHDATLQRATGHDLAIATHRFAEMRDLPAGYPGRFGVRHADNRLARLSELVDLLREWPAVTAFVEIKAECYARFGDAGVDRVLTQLGPAASRSVVISFEPAVLQRTRARHGLPVGWILPAWTTATRDLADHLAPDCLLVNRKRLPHQGEPLWPGPWRWAVYTVNDPCDVDGFLGRGFDLVETDRIGALLQSATAPREP